MMMRQKKKLKSRHSSDTVQAVVMLTPQVIGFLIFGLYPILWILSLVMYDSDGFQKIFIGLDNFTRAFRDAYYWKAVGNTFLLSAGKLLIELPLALVVAVILNGKIRGRNAFRTIMFLPNVISVAIIGLIFYFLFATFEGVVNELMMFLNIIDMPIDWFGNKWTSLLVLVIASVWHGVGINMLYFLTGLQNIPLELYESADIDGANAFQKFFRITIPMLAPVLQVVLMLAIINSFRITDLVLVLTNGAPAGGTEVMMTYVFKYFFAYGETTTAIRQVGYASSLAFISAIILGLLTVAYMTTTKKISRGAR